MMSTDALKELSCGPLWLLLNGSDILSIDADLIAVTKKMVGGIAIVASAWRLPILHNLT